MIDIEAERVVTLTEAAELIPRRRQHKKCHRATIFRWTRHGLKGVVLESIPIGGTRFTSREALKRFFQRLAEVDSQSAGPAPSPPKSPKPTAMRRDAVAAARRRMARAGK